MKTTEEVLEETGISYVMLTRLKDFGVIPRPQLQGKGEGGGRGVVGVFPNEVVEVIKQIKEMQEKEGLSLSRIAEKWREGEVLEEALDTLEIDYNEVVKPSERVFISADEDPAQAYLNSFDSFNTQLKKLYPGYEVSSVKMITVTIAGQEYSQPGRITMQRIRGIVPPIEG